MKIKAITASIYRNPKYGDCSNNGITSKYDEIIIPCSDGYIDIDTDNLPENYCEFEHGFAGSVHFVPHFLKSSTMGMMGGCFAYSSDSRFSRLYGSQPVAIHDRVE